MSLFDPDFFDKSKYIESLFAITMSFPQASPYERVYQELLNHAYNYKNTKVPINIPPELEYLQVKHIIRFTLEDATKSVCDKHLLISKMILSGQNNFMII